jgi:hypothetical protein
MLAITWGMGAVWGQSGPADGTPAVSRADAKVSSTADAGVVQTGCSSCGGGIGSLPPLTDAVPGAIEGGCGGAHCVPGGKYCDCCCNCDGCIGKFVCGLYQCICCPDPCYQGHWTPIQDAAFFVDSVRPTTQMRLRVTSAWDFTNPDRGEWFMARFNTVPENQIGPGNPCAPPNIPGKGPHTIWQRADYGDLSVYMESGTDKASISVETSYREIDPSTSALEPLVGTVPGVPVGGVLSPACKVSGFADTIIGAKSLILDCELIQIGLLFKTYIPSGNFTAGLGTGHVSLEPGVLIGLNLAPTWYLQFQTAYWIPIAGDPLYQSNVWHTHLSLNHTLWAPCHDFQIIGTLEASEWTFFQGSYTGTDFLFFVAPGSAVPNTAGTLAPVALGAGACMVSVGPGVRAFLCDKIDIGVGTHFAVTGSHLEGEMIRADFRWRF